MTLKIGDYAKVKEDPKNEWSGKGGYVDRDDADPSFVMVRFGSRLIRQAKTDLTSAKEPKPE